MGIMLMTHPMTDSSQILLPNQDHNFAITSAKNYISKTGSPDISRTILM